MKFQARTSDKRQLEVNWDRVNTYLSKWPPGTVLDIEIVKRVPRKSNPMRKLYFAAVLPEFAKYLGYDPDEYLLFHRQLKIVYFQIEPDKKGIYRKVPHVFSNDSDIPVPEKKVFVDWVLRKAAMEGKYIEIKK
jgi:hypothetical protein